MPQQIRDLLGEDQRAGTRARVAKARDNDIALAGLAMTDRDLVPGLPEVELADLPGPINRALVGARRPEHRAHLTQVVIDDRLAAIKPKRRDQLPDPLPSDLRVIPEQPVDLILKRIELRPARRAPIDRRLVAVNRSTDGVPMQPGPTVDLPHRQATHEVQPPDLRPLLHSDHLGPPRARSAQTSPGSAGHRTTLTWPKFQPAQVAQFHPAPTAVCAGRVAVDVGRRR